MRCALVFCLTACTTSGSLDLDLELPQSSGLRPQGMTTVTVLASSADMPETENTSLLDGSSFAAGDLPVDNQVQIDVLLRDESSRLVGVGEAEQRVDIVADRTTDLTIQVRKPFVYASDGKTLYSYDPTLDSRDPSFQGKVAGVASPIAVVPVGGSELAIGEPGEVQIIDTATDVVSQKSIALPSGATLHDLAPVPGTHQIAIAHSMGISIADLDSLAINTAAVGSVDRVTVGPGSDGKMVAYGLVGAAKPASSPLVACTGTSSLIAVSVDSPQTGTPTALPDAVAGIAAAPDQAALFAVAPCTGEVDKVGGTLGFGDAPASGPITLDKVSSLPNAAVIAVLSDRVWAAGTASSTAVCESGSCSTSTQIGCPEPSGNHLAYTQTGAHLIVQSIPIAGGDTTEIDLPARTETMINTDDPAHQHAQVLNSLGDVPTDLVVLPGDQYISLVTQSQYYIESLTDGPPPDNILLPCLLGTTGDWLLIDSASTSIAARVRTECNLTVGPSDFFTMWQCGDTAAGEGSTNGDYMPTTVGALFGAR
ncbi:MAG TPA: hypothetical protein VLX92_16180 [Kofleriaceae bacterium]|nr:hypothetical protein [Kofleriaceae bacterium]